MQSTINFIYNTVRSKRKKERFETILEPLQAILQISYLAFLPIGTKLTIHNNILQIQFPCYSQPVIRWYNNDTQEDLFYLFNIFYRFKKFYYFMNDSSTSNENKKLFDILVELAKLGICNLIRTYSQTDKIHILHTLQMYKTILESDTKGKQNGEILYQKRFDNFETQNLLISPDSHAPHASHIFKNTQVISGGGGSGAAGTSPPTSSGSFLSLKREKDKDKKVKTMHKVLRDDSPDQHELQHNKDQDSRNSTQENEVSDEQDSSGRLHKEVNNIDDVFIRITSIYTQEIYNIIYNILVIMSKNDTGHEIYIEGLNKMLEPTNIKIKKWIDENIVF